MSELTMPELTSQIEALFKSYLESPSNFNFDLSALQLRIHIKGSAWAGIVDKPLAKFLIDLDKTLSDKLAEHGIQIPETPHGLVALKVEDGSLDAVLQYSKGIIQEVRKLKPKDQIFLAVVIFGALGIWQAPDIIEKLNEDKIAQIESVERVNLVKAASSAQAMSRDLEAPLRALVNRMNDSDVIQLPGRSDMVPKKEAKKLLVKGHRSKPEQFYIDGCYIVEELSTKEPNEWEIGLVWGGIHFKAKLMLNSSQVEELMSSYHLAHASGSNIAPDFQITAKINAKGVQSATVIGMGDQRKDSKTIGEVLESFKKSEAGDEVTDEAAEE